MVSGGAAVARLLDGMPLLDGHCHPILATEAGAAELGRYCTEGPGSAVGGWDSPVSHAIRRWCAPVLDLMPAAPPGEYVRRRAQLGHSEVAARLLRAARLSHLLVDTGLRGHDLADPATLADAAGAPVSIVVRLETVAEDLARAGVTAREFASAYVERLSIAAAGAVAVKSVAAYRHGLDLSPRRPSPSEVADAAGRWLGGSLRLSDPVLLRFVLWAGVDLGLPVQVHAGFGDRDLALSRADPALLQPLLEAVEPTGVPVVLLHCYPFHRHAGWLASVYPHVYLDVGLTVGQVGARAEAVLGECMELAPTSKMLFSTDGYRLPELYLVGAHQFRHSFGRLLAGWVDDGALSSADAASVAHLVGSGNARRVYSRLST
jgi:predicted TIM-barrel fold metal-dependent hydrolase